MNDENKYKSDLVKLVSAVKRLNEEVRVLNLQNDEPIAIIGMSCVYPGHASNIHEFWNMLENGIDAITEIPKERFNVDDFYDSDPDVTGKMYSRSGGFIDDVDMFDAAFFGISPREALALDPQQRVLLQQTWLAFEHAGVVAEKLVGSKTGAFVGMAFGDYMSVLENSPQRPEFESHMVTGNSLSAAAGRLSYTFGLQGPAITMDTACSSSLVAIHLACEHLRNGSCDMAVAAGVNIIAAPGPYIGLSRTRALAFDSHCKTFDETADGYARGEGCGVLILKRLSTAIKDGDNIIATIRGSAVNQDGRSSSFTAPNGIVQEALIQEALQKAGVKASEVSYVETHGTGTPLGDPIEVNSLAKVYRVNRDPAYPLTIGTVKTNIGHTESAAGVAGVIKTVLSMQHKKIPKHLNFKKLNPQIDLDSIPALIPTEMMPWDKIKNKRIAGVSSFGISGTNAHLILEEYVSNNSNGDINAGTYEQSQILCLSAKNPESLAKLAEKYSENVLNNSANTLSDISYSANVSKSHFSNRLAIVANSKEQALENIKDWRAGIDSVGIYNGVATEHVQDRIAMLFTGQGSQYVGMGKGLYDTAPVFKAALDECAEILSKAQLLDKPLLSILWGEDSVSLDETKYTQPALFAFEYALYKLWNSWGITPLSVMGHSVGEYVAACVAGVFSVTDGLKLISKRAALMQALPRNGAMVVIAADESTVLSAIEPNKNIIAIAAVNGPNNVVISGDAVAVKSVASSFEAKNIKVTELKVSHAFHSHLLEPMLADFEKALNEVAFSEPKISLISNLTGKEATKGQLTNAKYWLEHTRRAVKFASGVTELVASGVQYFIEIGPHPVLLAMASECIAENDNYLWLASLRRDKDNWLQLLDSVSKIYVKGASIDWPTFYKGSNARHIDLPSYPFQKQSYWAQRGKSSIDGSKEYGDILGHALSSPIYQETIYDAIYNVENIPLLLDHRVYQTVVVPGAFHISRIINWVSNVLGKKTCVIQDMAFDKAIVLKDDQTQRVQLILNEVNNAKYNWQVFSALENSDQNENNLDLDWSLNAKGILLLDNDINKQDMTIDLAAIKKLCSKELPINEYNKGLLKDRYQYGSGFVWVEQVWTNDTEALGLMRQTTLAEERNGLIMQPGLIDCCFQLLSACTIGMSQSFDKMDVAYIPISIQEFIFNGNPNSKLWCHVKLDAGFNSSSKLMSGDMELFDDGGKLVAKYVHFTAIQAPASALLRDIKGEEYKLLYEINWIEKKLELSEVKSSQTNNTWLVFAEQQQQNVASALSKQLLSEGGTVIEVIVGEKFSKINENKYTVNPTQKNDFVELLQILGNDINISKIIYCWGLDTNYAKNSPLQTLLDDQSLSYMAVVFLVQALATVKNNSKLILLTNDVHSINNKDKDLKLSQAPMWGLGRVIAIERPELQCKMFDLSYNENFENVVQKLFKLITLDTLTEDQLALREDYLFVPRLLHSKRIAKVKNSQNALTNDVVDEIAIKDNVSYLITGGLGGLGLEIAKWLIAKGAKHIALIGRKAPNDAVAKQIQDWNDDGIQVKTYATDISVQSDVTIMFDKLSKDMPPLAGIIHAAGVIDDAVLTSQDLEKYNKVIAPKILGAINLQTYLIANKENNLDFFVSFSSAASVLGNIGQANYAAANAFLDSFAHYQRHNNIPGISINWGAWGEVGLAANMDKASQEQMRLIGIQAFSTEMGIAALEQIICQEANKTELAVLDVNWQRYFSQVDVSTMPVLLTELEQNARTSKNSISSDKNNEFIQSLTKANPADRYELLSAYLEGEVKKVLGLAGVAAIDRGENLAALGMDSLMAVEFRNRITKTLGGFIGKALPATLIFNYPNIKALAGYILEDDDAINADKSNDIQPVAIEIVSIPVKRPNAKIRMFCFLYAGGDIQTYYPWAKAISSDIEVCCIAPMSSIRGDTEMSFEAIANKIVDAILPLINDKKFIFFGHSMGTIVSYEVARLMRKRSLLEPSMLALSCLMPPDKQVEILSALMMEETQELLFNEIGVPIEFMQDEQWHANYKKNFFKDISILASYNYVPEEPLQSTLTLFYGSNDVLASKADVEAWAKYSSNGCTIHEIIGGHFDIVAKKSFDSVLGVIEHKVIDILRST